MELEAEVVVVGAGIVGLATAWQLMQRFPTKSIIVVDKERSIASHQTGRNSGVIHSGIYYRTGTLKAALCVRGRSQLLDFMNDHEIPYELSGKVIVARTSEELPLLRQLFDQGQRNSVAGLRLIDGSELRRLEPEAAGVAAISSPSTGIVDYRQVAQAMADDLIRAGHLVTLGTPVDSISSDPQGVGLWRNGNKFLRGRYAIVAAGLYSDILAYRSGLSRNPRIVPFRGEYWSIDNGRPLVRSMIYPIPDKRFPFLGVHFTRRLRDGAILVGPNAVLGLAREHYQRQLAKGIRVIELMPTLTFQGFWRMAFRYWKPGLAEMHRSLFPMAYLRLAQQYVPALTRDGLLPGPVGVRAQTIDVSGAMSDDFIIDQMPRVLFVRNAPSPAATASLAIGEYLIGQATQRFGW